MRLLTKYPASLSLYAPSPMVIIMSVSGFVYVLIDPTMPGLVKVGWTSRDVETRAAELSSSTGVGSPFIVVYKEFFSDGASVERSVHAQLEHHGFRLAMNREFFKAEPSDVIKIIAAMPGKSHPNTSTSFDDDSDELLTEKSNDLDDLTLEDYRPKTLAEQVFEEADECYYGFNDTIQDFEEAMVLYKKAAKLGSVDAFIMIGRMYADGEGVREDLGKALSFYKEAAGRGSVFAYGYMTDIFQRTGNSENHRKAWRLFMEKIDQAPSVTSQVTTIDALLVSNLLSFTTQGIILSGPKVNVPRNDVSNRVLSRFASEISECANRMVELGESKGYSGTPGHKAYQAVAKWAQNIR